MDIPKPNQHFRISLEQAKRDYQDGIITAAGLIYYAIGTYRKPGHKLKIPNIDSFCQLLGINNSTFYRVISKLRMQRRVNWEATDGLNVWLLEESPVIQLIQDRASQLQIGDSELQIGDSELQIGDSELQIGDSELQIGDSELQIGDSELQIGDSELQIGDSELQIGDSELQIGEFRASKPAADNASRPSSYSYQLFLISLSNSERENFEKFVERKIGQLPSKPVLPQKWIEKNLAELESEFRSTEGNRRSVNLPNLEQMKKLQQMKDAGEIRDFGLQPYKKAQTIVVDDGSEVLPWWEFFESR